MNFRTRRTRQRGDEADEQAARDAIVRALGDPESNVVPLPERRRVLLIASGGGHWIELARLAAAFRHCDCQFVSTTPNLAAPVGERAVWQVTDSSRDSTLTMLSTIREIWRVLHRFRPDMVVSTGAAPGAIALYIAKFMGLRTIWIDSIANSDELSMSGRMVRFAADLWLTQWPHLAQTTGRLQYFGRVL